MHCGNPTQNLRNIFQMSGWVNMKELRTGHVRATTFESGEGFLSMVGTKGPAVAWYTQHLSVGFGLMHDPTEP